MAAYVHVRRRVRPAINMAAVDRAFAAPSQADDAPPTARRPEVAADLARRMMCPCPTCGSAR